jgi:transcriptional regulator with XRE-family HTH domain
MIISEKLKQARSSCGLSEEEVADKVGVSRQTMSNWENGRSFPDIVSVIGLSDIYGISLDSLVKGDAEMIKHLDESTNVTKSNKQVAASIIALILCLLGTLGSIVLLGGRIGYFLDPNTLSILFIPLLAVLTLTRSFKLFGTGFIAAFFPKRKASEELMINAAALYRLLSKITVFAVLFNFIISIMNMLLFMDLTSGVNAEAFAVNFGTTMLPLAYGLIMLIFFFEPVVYILRRKTDV